MMSKGEESVKQLSISCLCAICCFLNGMFFTSCDTSSPILILGTVAQYFVVALFSVQLKIWPFQMCLCLPISQPPTIQSDEDLRQAPTTFFALFLGLTAPFPRSIILGTDVFVFMQCCK